MQLNFASIFVGKQFAISSVVLSLLLSQKSAQTHACCLISVQLIFICKIVREMVYQDGRTRPRGVDRGRGAKGAKPTQFWINENRCAFNKITIQVNVSCIKQCPRTPAARTPRLTVSLYLSSSGSNKENTILMRGGLLIFNSLATLIFDCMRPPGNQQMNEWTDLS